MLYDVHKLFVINSRCSLCMLKHYGIYLPTFNVTDLLLARWIQPALHDLCTTSFHLNLQPPPLSKSQLGSGLGGRNAAPLSSQVEFYSTVSRVCHRSCIRNTFRYPGVCARIPQDNCSGWHLLRSERVYQHQTEWFVSSESVSLW